MENIAINIDSCLYMSCCIIHIELQFSWNVFLFGMFSKFSSQDDEYRVITNYKNLEQFVATNLKYIHLLRPPRHYLMYFI